MHESSPLILRHPVSRGFLSMWRKWRLQRATRWVSCFIFATTILVTLICFALILEHTVRCRAMWDGVPVTGGVTVREPPGRRGLRGGNSDKDDEHNSGQA